MKINRCCSRREEEQTAWTGRDKKERERKRGAAEGRQGEVVNRC